MQSGTTITLPRDIDADLDHWLDPFLDATGRSTRRKMAPLYVRGLLGSGGRKSVQPMAERLGWSSHDPLHHFISSPAWDDAPLWRVLAEQVDRQVGGAGAVLVVDDVGIPKKGELSVGVARQYCGALGKVANCQVLVSLTLARGEVPVPVHARRLTGRNRRMAVACAGGDIARHEQHRQALGTGSRPSAECRFPLRGDHDGGVLPPVLSLAASVAPERALLPLGARGRGRRLPRLQALRPERRPGAPRPGGGARRLRLHGSE